jgi:hypothetical protein
MTELFIPESAEDDNEDGKITVNYEPSQEDEEKFMLMYFLHVQPSEIDFDLKDEERRRWVLGRFMMQKQMEQQAMAERRATMQLAQGLDLSNLKSR